MKFVSTFVVVFSCLSGAMSMSMNCKDDFAHGNNVNQACSDLGYTHSQGNNYGCTTCDAAECCFSRCTSGWNTNVCRGFGFESYNGGNTVCAGVDCLANECCGGFTGTGDFDGGIDDGQNY